MIGPLGDLEANLFTTSNSDHNSWTRSNWTKQTSQQCEASEPGASELYGAMHREEVSLRSHRIFGNQNCLNCFLSFSTSNRDDPR